MGVAGIDHTVCMRALVYVFSQSPSYDMQSPLHHLLPYSCTIFQAVLTASSLVVALSVSVLVKLTPIGLVPEVPLLQVSSSVMAFLASGG